MQLSMTGFGDARAENDRIRVTVEVRTVNNRYLKINAKYSDSLANVEGDIEKLIRKRIVRGTVSVIVRVRHLDSAYQYQLDGEVLSNYWQQLVALAEDGSVPLPAGIGELLELPGVLVESEGAGIDRDVDWPVIKSTLKEALARLGEFREREGQSMQADLAQNCTIIETELEAITEHAPQVVREYRHRILDRVNEMLAESDATVSDDDLIREVSIFADRCDINEEITRLQCHIDQFRTLLKAKESAGRKLEFLCQEMFREVNTIGSKANNVAIAHHVVEMKSAVEKMREIVQNIE